MIPMLSKEFYKIADMFFLETIIPKDANKTEDIDEISKYCDHDVQVLSEAIKRYYTRYPAVTNVIFNYPATIVFWDDGTKTVVKCNENEDSFDPEKGFAMAVTKKYFGNKGNYYNHVRAALEKYHPSADLFDMIAKVIDDVMKGINGHEK